MLADASLFPDASPEEIQDLNTAFLGRHLLETLPLETLNYHRPMYHYLVAEPVDLRGSYPLTEGHYLVLKRLGFYTMNGHWDLYEDFTNDWFQDLKEVAQDMGLKIALYEGQNDKLYVHLDHKHADKESIETARRVLHTVPEARKSADEIAPALLRWFKLVEVIRESLRDPDALLLGYFQEQHAHWKAVWSESGSKGGRVYNAVKKRPKS